MESELGTWDSVLLEHLTEDNFIHNIQQRYEQDSIYVRKILTKYSITDNFI